MKHLISLLCLLLLPACVLAQTSGQNVIQKKNASAGFSLESFTLSNSQLIGRTSGGTLSGITIGSGLSLSGTTLTSSGGSGLDNVASTITGGTLTLAGTLTAGRTLTVRDVAGTIALTSDLSAYLTTSTAASTYEPILNAGTTGQYYRGDKTWQTLNATAVGLGNVSNALQLVAANNLSDLANAGTARTNLGLGTLATQNGTISDYLTSATAATTYQPLSSTLTTLSSATAAGLALMDDANAAAQRTTLGLGNVDNTADADKPISTATQTALDAKAPLASPTFTGTITLGYTSMASGVITFTQGPLYPTRTFSVGGTGITWENINGSGKWTSLRPNEPSTSGVTYFNPNGLLISTADTGTVTNAMLAGSIAASKLVGTDIATVGTITTGTWQGSVIAPAYLGTGSSISTKYLRGDGTWQTIAGGGDALTTSPLSQFASTTSSQLAGVLTDETGTGAVVLASSPALTTPNLGTPSAATLTNATGLPLSTGVTGTLPIANGGTGQTSQTAAFDALAPTTTKGDLIVSNGSDNIRVAVGATNGHVLTVDSAEASGVKWAAASGGGSSTDTQLYTANATWTNPSPSTPKRVFVRLVGGGGGGGSGRKGAAGTIRCGGGGGASAAVTEFWTLTTDLGATASVTIGAGGTGAASVSSNDTNGSAGSTGGDTNFNSTTANGGGGGGGGTAESGAAGSAGGTTVIGLSAVTPGAGAAASTSGGSGGAPGVVPYWVPTGGGAGGGVTSGDSASVGGVAGGMGQWNTILEVTGGTAGATSGAGGNGNAGRGSGTGGGGGGGSTSSNGGAGGNGGGAGAGGGGGGAATNSVGNSGAGGNGSAGYALIITYL